METLHTKGNWKILWGNYTHFATINKDVNTRICAIEISDVKQTAEVRANVKLIAAAPELLEACDMVLTAWHSKPSNMYKKEPLYLEVIRKAINKATE